MASDIGGTFTDLALFDPSSQELRITKSASTPDDPVAGVTAVIEKAGISPEEIHVLVHGTTVGTNALLERTKQLPALISTAGFKDIPFIQRINRKHHYDLDWDKPKPFVRRRDCFEAVERINYKGDVVTPLDEQSARNAIEAVKEAGITDIAVSFLFSYVNPVHELRMRGPDHRALSGGHGLSLPRGLPPLARVRPGEHSARRCLSQVADRRLHRKPSGQGSTPTTAR